MSYLAAAACIISTAQHARPNVMGHNDDARAQLTISSSLVTTKSALLDRGDEGESPSKSSEEKTLSGETEEEGGGGGAEEEEKRSK